MTLQGSLVNGWYSAWGMVSPRNQHRQNDRPLARSQIPVPGLPQQRCRTHRMVTRQQGGHADPPSEGETTSTSSSDDLLSQRSNRQSGDLSSTIGQRREIEHVEQQNVKLRDRVEELETELGSLQARCISHEEHIAKLTGSGEQRMLEKDQALCNIRQQLEYEKRERTISSQDSEAYINRLENQIRAGDHSVVSLQEHLRETRHRAAIDLDQFRKAERSLQMVCQQKAGEVETLQEKNGLLKQNLEDCTEKIFQLQPPQIVTDTDISSAYQALRVAIDSWVGTICTHAGDTMRSMIAAERGELARVVKNFHSLKEWELYAKFPAIDNPMVGAFVMRFIWAKMLQPHKVVLGIGDGREAFLKMIISAMKRLDPPKDTHAIELWKVELIRALNEVPEYRESFKRSTLRLAQDLTELLPPKSIEADEGAEDHAEFLNIMDEAAKLSNSIRLSTERYDWESSSHLSAPENVLYFDNHKTYKIINAIDGQPIRPSSIIPTGNDGRVGEILCTMVPALIRKSAKGKDIVLAKSTILVRFDGEVTRKPKNRKGEAKAQKPSDEAFDGVFDEVDGEGAAFL